MGNVCFVPAKMSLMWFAFGSRHSNHTEVIAKISTGVVAGVFPLTLFCAL